MHLPGNVSQLESLLKTTFALYPKLSLDCEEGRLATLRGSFVLPPRVAQRARPGNRLPGCACPRVKAKGLGFQEAGFTGSLIQIPASPPHPPEARKSAELQEPRAGAPHLPGCRPLARREPCREAAGPPATRPGARALRAIPRRGWIRSRVSRGWPGELGASRRALAPPLLAMAQEGSASPAATHRRAATRGWCRAAGPRGRCGRRCCWATPARIRRAGRIRGARPRRQARPSAALAKSPPLLPSRGRSAERRPGPEGKSSRARGGEGGGGPSRPEGAWPGEGKGRKGVPRRAESLRAAAESFPFCPLSFAPRAALWSWRDYNSPLPRPAEGKTLGSSGVWRGRLEKGQD